MNTKQRGLIFVGAVLLATLGLFLVTLSTGAGFPMPSDQPPVASLSVAGIPGVSADYSRADHRHRGDGGGSGTIPNGSPARNYLQWVNGAWTPVASASSLPVYHVITSGDGGVFANISTPLMALLTAGGTRLNTDDYAVAAYTCSRFNNRPASYDQMFDGGNRPWIWIAVPAWRETISNYTALVSWTTDTQNTPTVMEDFMTINEVPYDVAYAELVVTTPPTATEWVSGRASSTPACLVYTPPPVTPSITQGVN